eukprot:TRINITY_DN17241_c0_g1_i2.p2 TRINITY_DN17241_c0_g1~~TRINITY_DN17241_c0_g1_i2.p2  ORF type:complete len:160 (-),score=80.97 TRINITY_DN17241_c0_g1_i2:155-634(-)
MCIRDRQETKTELVEARAQIKELAVDSKLMRRELEQRRQHHDSVLHSEHSTQHQIHAAQRLLEQERAESSAVVAELCAEIAQLQGELKSTALECEHLRAALFCAVNESRAREAAKASLEAERAELQQHMRQHKQHAPPKVSTMAWTGPAPRSTAQHRGT